MYYQDTVKIEKKFVNLDYNWQGKSVLDIGCNIGLLYEYLNQRGISDYTGVDKTPKDIKEAKRRNKTHSFYIGDLLEYTDYKADVFVVMAVFHHLSEDKVKTFLKKCKADELIFEVPVGDDPNFVRYKLRTEQWYMEAVEDNYGTVLEVAISGATNDPYNQRLIFVCKKDV